jgi:hypothetical protein
MTTSDKIRYPGQSRRQGILEHIMTGILAKNSPCPWKTTTPFLKEKAGKTKIPATPEKQHRFVAKPIKTCLNSLESVPGWMCWMHGNILNKAMNGYPLPPGAIGMEESMPNLFRHGPMHGHDRGRAGKPVQTPHQQRAQDGPAADGDAQGQPG